MSTKVCVLVKNRHTKKVTKYKSIKSANDFLKSPPSSLYRMLHNPNAVGRTDVLGHLVKLDDGLPWPKDPVINTLGAGRAVNHISVLMWRFNTPKNSKLVSSLSQAARLSGVAYSKLYVSLVVKKEKMYQDLGTCFVLGKPNK